MASTWCRRVLLAHRPSPRESIAIAPRNARQHREKTQAASQNHAKARCNLGIMFASGIGVARDDSKAARYYLAAATGGVPRAMFDLAVLYARGRGVLKDDVAAVAWCERAAVAGDAAACVNMAHVLGQGLVGRCPDSRAARRWLDLATRRRGSRRDDARDTAVSSLVTAAPAPQLRSLVPGPAPCPPTRSADGDDFRCLRNFHRAMMRDTRQCLPSMNTTRRRPQDALRDERLDDLANVQIFDVAIELAHQKPHLK